jgi:hypothetical protein
MPYNCKDCKYFDSHYYIKCGTCKDNSHFEQKEEAEHCSNCLHHYGTFYNNEVCIDCEYNNHSEQKEEINTCSTCKFRKDDNSNFGSSPCTSCFNFSKWVDKEAKPVHEIKCCLCKFYDYQYDETLGEQFERCKNPMNCKNFKSRILTNDKENNSTKYVLDEAIRIIQDCYAE